MKYNYLALNIAIALSASNVAVADEIGVISQGKGIYAIESGSTITVNTDDIATAITADKNDVYSVADNGGIKIDVKTSDGNVKGVLSQNSGEINLGSGSEISVENTGTAPAIGMSASSGGKIDADDVNITVKSQGQAIGISIERDSSVKLTGDNNHLNVYGSNQSGQVTALAVIGQEDQIASFEAENLTINTNGIGIQAQPYSTITLTGETFINSVRGGIESSGGFDSSSIVNIDTVHVKTTGSASDTGGLFAQLGGKIIVGEGSSVETENMHGLYAASITSTSSTTIDYIGSETERNSISVNGLTAVTSNGGAAVINLNNTDIHAQAKNSNVIGIRAVDGGVVNAKNTTITVSDSQTDFASIAAVAAIDENSMVNLSGNTIIDASQAQDNIALITAGNASEISVTDSAIIKGDIITQGNNTKINLDLHDASIFTGSSTIRTEDDDGNPYIGSTVNINLTDSTWNMVNDSEVTSLTLDSNSILNLNSNALDTFTTANTLTIAGDYTGNGGLIIFNGKLEGDDSVIDHLTVKGDTDGTTIVRVNNIGGQGAQTVNGIELISVEGNSNGQFNQEGRIVSGSYDYTLVSGQGENSNNWYLTSSIDPNEPSNPLPEESAVRPEAGGYINNLYEANNMFNLRLHDRHGKTEYTDIMTGEKKITSLWLRSTIAHTNSKSGYGQLKTGSNRFVNLFGGDIAQWSNDGMDSYSLGIMVGYGSIKSNTTNHLTGYRATSHADGYSMGVYGTYYTNQEEKTGLYVDSWLQYNWFKNKIDGDLLAEEKYHSKGVTASVESGYTFTLHETMDSNGSAKYWYIQPKAQVTYMGVKMNSYTETNGTQVSGQGKNNIQTRLGIRLFEMGYDRTDDGFRPFIEANWIYNTKNAGVSMDGDVISQAGTRNIGEIKLGIQDRLTNNIDLWLNVAQQFGDNSYTNTQGMLGIKVHF